LPRQAEKTGSVFGATTDILLLDARVKLTVAATPEQLTLKAPAVQPQSPTLSCLVSRHGI